MKKEKLNFLKRVLTDSIDGKTKQEFLSTGKFPSKEVMTACINAPIDDKRNEGLDHPQNAHTMIGLKRLHNLHDTLDYVRENNIEGDFIETGVWRGGACIFAKKYFQLYDMDIKLFVVDSFDGLPLPDLENYPQDEGDKHHQNTYLAVSLEDVKSNFELYNAIDDNVIFIKGWFKDTLPNNDDIGKLSVLRFDGDMYGSTMDVLNNIYDKVVSEGIIIIDDYCLPNCVKAVTDFRNERNITDELRVVDRCGVWWVKE